METERLVCRRPAKDDSGDYRRLFLAPEVGRWLRPPPLEPFTKSGIVRILGADLAHWKQHGYGPWLIGESKSGEYAGRVGLRWTELEGQAMVELLWAIHPDFQGRGYAGEVASAAIETAREVGIDRLVALTTPDNQASLRVMEKIGLDRVGGIEHAGLPHMLYEIQL